MNKKKFLLSTTIASAMFITGMTASSYATITDEAEDLKDTNVLHARFKGDGWLDNGRSSVAIELKAGKTALTKTDVVKILEKEYSNGIVAKINDKAISEIAEDETVGTGAKVTLQSGKDLYIVLFGDLTGDGVIDIEDAFEALSIDFNGTNPVIDILRAADITDEGEEGRGKIDMSDAFELLSFDFVEDSAKTRFVKDVKLPATNRVEILHLNGAVATVGKDNTANINPVVDGKNITIYADKATIGSTNTTLNVTVDTGVAYEFPEDYVEANGVFKKVVGEATKLNIVMDVTDTEKTIALKAETEILNVTVKVEDITAPTFVSARKAENTSDKNFTENMKAVVGKNFTGVGDGGVVFDAAAKTITVNADVNAMKAYDRTVDGKTVNGKWIAVLVKTNNKVAKLSNETDTKYGATDEEVIYWIDAQKGNPANLVLQNKNAGEVEAKTVIAITVTDTGSVKLTSVAARPEVPASDATEDNNKPVVIAENVKDDFNANQKLLIDKVKKTGNTVEIKASLGDMKQYNKQGEVKTWIALNVAYTVPGENDPEPKKQIVWLEAIEGTQTVKIENTDKDGKVETLEIPVTIVDVTAPKAESAVVVEGENSGAIYDADTTDSTPAVAISVNNIKVQTNLNAMKTSKRNDDTEGKKWFALTIETGIKGLELAGASLTDKDVTLDGTKVTVWVDATAAEETSGTAKNVIVKGPNSANTTFAITTKDISVMRFNVATHLTAATLPEVEKVASFMNATNYAALRNNIAVMTIADSKIKVNLNAMKEFSYDGKVAAGKWFPVLMDVNVIKSGLQNPGYGISDSINAADFGATTDEQLVVWIDANKLVKQENGTYKTTVTLNSKTGETISIDLAAEDTSVLKLNGAVLAQSAAANGLTPDAYAIYKENMKYVKIASVDAKTNTVNLNVDFSRVNKYTSPGGEKNWFAVLLDLGEETNKYVSGTYNIMDGQEKAGTEVWTPAGDIEGVTKANLILLWLDAKTDRKASLRREVVAPSGTEGTAGYVPGVYETIEFTINVTDTAMEEVE